MTLVEASLVTISILLALILLVLIMSSATRLPNLDAIGASLRNVKKSAVDSQVGGVCGGLGQSTVVPSWLWRVIFLLLLFCGGFGLLLYIIMAICMPSAEP